MRYIIFLKKLTIATEGELYEKTHKTVADTDSSQLRRRHSEGRNSGNAVTEQYRRLCGAAWGFDI